MKKILPIILPNNMQIIPYMEIPYFLKSQYQKWRVLAWYELFIIVPWECTLPVPDLFFDIQDLKLNSLERVWLALLEILDIDNVKEIFNSHLESLSKKEQIENINTQETIVENYKYWYQEWIKYLEWKESKAIVGCELIYDK